MYPESDTAESLAHQDHKTIAKRELDLTDEQLESEDFEQILTDVVGELFEPKNTSPDTAKLEVCLLKKKFSFFSSVYFAKIFFQKSKFRNYAGNVTACDKSTTRNALGSTSFLSVTQRFTINSRKN